MTKKAKRYRCYMCGRRVPWKSVQETYACGVYRCCRCARARARRYGYYVSDSMRSKQAKKGGMAQQHPPIPPGSSHFRDCGGVGDERTWWAFRYRYRPRDSRGFVEHCILLDPCDNDSRNELDVWRKIIAAVAEKECSDYRHECLHNGDPDELKWVNAQDDWEAWGRGEWKGDEVGHRPAGTRSRTTPPGAAIRAGKESYAHDNAPGL